MLKEDIFENNRLWTAMFKMTIPTIFSSLFVVIYNLVDVFWIGQIGNPNEMAALVLSMPIFMLMMALGNILGVGGSSYISRLLGKKDFKEIIHHHYLFGQNLVRNLNYLLHHFHYCLYLSYRSDYYQNHHHNHH